MVPRPIILVPLLGLPIHGLAVAAAAGPLDLFTGSFSASGIVIEGPTATTHQVSCSFMSSGDGDTSLTLRGTCWAYLIIARTVTADLLLDPRSGRVSGTYTGARVGTADLSGKRQTSGFDLVIKWPKPVFGSTTSNLQIVSLARDRLRILILSRVGENGAVRPITDLILARR